MNTLRGACLCGRVTYAVPDDFVAAFNCHCSQCRRATGSAFKPMAVIPFDKIVLTKGQGDILIYGQPPGSHDVHCKNCGSFLFSFIASNGNGHVAMGSLIDTPTVRPQFHIFVASKADWHDITDGLPQFDRLPS